IVLEQKGAFLNGSPTFIFTRCRATWPADWRAEDISTYHFTTASRTHSRRRGYHIVRHFVCLFYPSFTHIPDPHCFFYPSFTHIPDLHFYPSQTNSLYLSWPFR